MEKKYNHEVQDEATNISLDLTVKKSALAFKKEDLLQLATNLLRADQLTTLEVEKDKSKVKISPSSEAKNVFSAQVLIVLKEKLSKEKIADEVLGKSYSSAQIYLSGLKSVRSVQIRSIPGFFGLFSHLPIKSQNLFVNFLIE
jgi:hypothetical protein